MGFEIDTKTVSQKAWGDVDKGTLGRALADGYRNGHISKEMIQEVYAYCPKDAFAEDADGKGKFLHSKAWGPHHEIAEQAILLSKGGLEAATKTMARSGLSKAGRKAAREHLRSHYEALQEAIPESLKERREVEPGQALDEAKGSLEYTMRRIREAFEKLYGYEGGLVRQPGTGQAVYYHIVETFADHLIVRSWEDPVLAPDEYYLVRYSQDNDGALNFAAFAEWEIVELTYQPRTEPMSAERQLGESSPRKASGKRIVDGGQVLGLMEAQAGQPRKIKGIGITADVVNGNNRRYPAAVLRAAVEELRGHLHESASQGRWVESPDQQQALATGKHPMGRVQEAQLLGEPEHPSDKATRRPTYLETVVKWTSVEFDGVHVLLEGQIIETSKGKDILALLEGGVLPGISQRAYGEGKYVTENGQRIEEVMSLTITGYDLVMEPSDPNAGITLFESKQEDADMTLEELKKLISENKDLFRGLVAEDLEAMGENQLKKLEESIRSLLGIGAQDDLSKALTEAAQAKQTLAAQAQRQLIESAIAEATKSLPYGKDLNARFVESVKAAQPANADAVKALVEAKRKEYDAIMADARLAAMGHVQMTGSVFEQETNQPDYARPSFEFTESLVRAGEIQPRNLNKPKNINERVAKLVLDRFDAVFGPKLKAEQRMLQEAETVSDLSLPYSVARTIVGAVWPQLVSTSIFDFGVTDQAPTKLFYETYAAESGLEVAISAEGITSVHDTWVALAHKRVKAATIVVKNHAENVTYTEGTDYVIDYQAGKLMALSTGTIVNNADTHVSYTYLSIREGENTAIQRAKMQLSSVDLAIAADRLATQITNEAVVFSRSQIGWDATTRTLASLIAEIKRKIDADIMYKAWSIVMTVASNSGGTWTAASDSMDLFSKYIGVARVKVAKRLYTPTAILMSTTNADTIANWSGFTQAGSRPDANLDANGYLGSLKGLPVFHSTEFVDSHAIVVNRQLVMHRVFQPMQLKGPFPSYSNGNLVAADQWYAEEYNGTDAPVANKGSYVKIA